MDRVAQEIPAAAFKAPVETPIPGPIIDGVDAPTITQSPQAPAGAISAPGGVIGAPGGEIGAPGGVIGSPLSDIGAPARVVGAPGGDIAPPGGAIGADGQILTECFHICIDFGDECRHRWGK